MSDPDAANRIDEIMGQASVLPEGVTQTSLIEEAVRLADSTRDVDAQFATRMELIRAATFSGQSEKALVAFSWCVSQYNRDMQRFGGWTYEMGWYFKYIMGAAGDFPNITQADAARIIEQMTTHYQRMGQTMRGVYSSQVHWLMDSGQLDAAAELVPKWQAERRDDMADCHACELDTMVDFYDAIGDPEKALKTAEPILNGTLSCAEVPHLTLATLLRPLAMLERFDEADAFQTRGYRMIRGNPEFLRTVARHIHYLVNRGRPRAPVNMVQRHFAWALDTQELRPRYLFYLAAHHALSALAEKSPNASLTLPSCFSTVSGIADPDLENVLDWLEEQIAQLARRFDERNGNDYYSRRLPEQMLY